MVLSRLDSLLILRNLFDKQRNPQQGEMNTLIHICSVGDRVVKQDTLIVFKVRESTFA